MGGAVSSGRDNANLIENLVKDYYIKTQTVERAFRAVDRAEYYLPNCRQNSYKDVAWKTGHLHISAPCIYAVVVEGLELKSGLSFLNLGSGTGYLSTVVGVILGSNGLNHGIELYEDVVEYANKKLESFKMFSGAMDEFDFCEPKFIQGNCLNLDNEFTTIYDRIYCGARVPKEYEAYMKNLIKIGGILIMILEDQLFQMKRIDEFQWNVTALLPVSFASLIPPADGIEEYLKMIAVDPASLQALSRTVIRNIIRRNIEEKHPGVNKLPVVKKNIKKKRTIKRMADPSPNINAYPNGNNLATYLYRLHDTEIPVDDTYSSTDDELNNTPAVYSRKAFLAEDNRESLRSKLNPNLNSNNITRPPKEPIWSCLLTEHDFSGSSNQEVEDDDDAEHNSLENKKIICSSDESMEPPETEMKKSQLRTDQNISPTTSSSMDNSDTSRKRERIDSSELEDDISDSSDEEDIIRSEGEDDNMRMYQSAYTKYMKEYLQQLPLPMILKKYLNYYRDFDVKLTGE